ncbi:lysylphosphatidylglycerol synthase domain-containing protein [Microbacterium sp. JZ31]|uniref:lysylphosphatidylglycerol synthase domain-containing protein n=1 Tax=Microbacterium sp. JZ31 TaxID=1906274 RepID=UPI001933BEEC|nr:lysylphosphatidylglycerol synthase domain-containing protein [Microbacterium sp. JZ31]
MKRVLAILRSPAVKWGFLALALGFAAWFVASRWDEILAALVRLPMWALLVALLASIVYVALTLESWRSILRDLGHPLAVGPAVALFGVSQLGKYIPGGVWNIAAAADLGRAHRIPARHSVAAMTLAVLISLVSGVGIGALGFAIAPTPALAGWAWLMWAGVPLLVLLAPPIMNRLIALAWRVLRLEPLDTAGGTLSTRGVGVATAWSALAWLVAGCSVGVLAIGLGAPATWHTLVQCVGGYALAWVIGFLFVVAPAGAGVREVVLAAALAGTLPSAEIVTLVLLSRVLLTAVDLGFAAVGGAETRFARRRMEAA